jgi:hypothetical protein
MAGLANTGGDLLGGFEIGIENSNVGAFSGEAVRNGFTDAAGSTGDVFPAVSSFPLLVGTTQHHGLGQL